MELPHAEKNDDIQVLRGIAVSLVVLFHSGVVPVPAGFLGVDIFFVISGFLITSHIIRDIDRQRFSLPKFYMRRAKRLLPATYCTLAFTIAGAWFMLMPSAWTPFINSLIGALTFTANIFLWQQTGYFDDASATKPLLHLWSLSVEEQFYMFLPLFLMILPGRFRLGFIFLALVGSAALCFVTVLFKPSAAFFLLPTRAWELLVCSLLASMVAKRGYFDAPLLARAPAIAIVVIIPFFPLDHTHPRFDAMLVTVATAVLLGTRQEWLKLGLVTRALSIAGDWSYSIYLVHWPLYAFAATAGLGKAPPIISAALIPISYLLGYLQYRFIEQPFRLGWQSNDPKYLKYLIAASLAVALPIPLYYFGPTLSVGRVDFAQIRRPNFGLDQACSYDTDHFDDRRQCRLSDAPQVALWGDSYAMQWGTGIASELHNDRLIQITKILCGPLRGLSFVDQGFPKHSAESCIHFNESVLNYLSQSASIKNCAAEFGFSPIHQRQAAKLSDR
ncbi:MAG: acyltransferase family protein [Xanthobacteraceae bacterium]